MFLVITLFEFTLTAYHFLPLKTTTKTCWGGLTSLNCKRLLSFISQCFQGLTLNLTNILTPQNCFANQTFDTGYLIS